MIPPNTHFKKHKILCQSLSVYSKFYYFFITSQYTAFFASITELLSSYRYVTPFCTPSSSRKLWYVSLKKPNTSRLISSFCKSIIKSLDSALIHLSKHHQHIQNTQIRSLALSYSLHWSLTLQTFS